MSDEEMRRRFFISNAKEIEQCFERGQDAAGMLGHFCNWEWLSRFGIYLPENRRVGLIYHPLRNKLFDKLFYNIRKTDSGVLIPMKRVPKILLQMKRDGYMNICGYISDQAPKWQNIHLWLPFFNHETPVFTGGERIMRKMNNAVYYLEMSRVKRGYYRCEYRLITQNAKDTEEFEITRSFFRMLEENVRRQPECYLWSHNRWKRTREEFDQRFKTENGKVILKEN